MVRSQALKPGVALACIVVGDVVWILAAAGAAGIVAAQLAKAHGCRVIGSAGSAEKVAYLTDVLGLDAAFNWRDGLDGPLSEFAPDGIDVYFDSVGGDHLKAALTHLRPLGRVTLCGAIDRLRRAAAGRPRQPLQRHH